MVYVVPNTLTLVSPSNPTSTDPLTFSAYVTFDLGNASCGAAFGLWTKTYLHLLMRGSTEPASAAEEVAMIDCNATCCFREEDFVLIPGHSNNGWLITFPVVPPTGAQGTFVFTAVDNGDMASKPSARIATASIFVTADPNDPCIQDECTTGCRTATLCGRCGNPACTGGGDCASSDYMCQIMDYVKKNPLVVVAGAVVLYLLLSPPRRK